ncbi:hypothetical protein ACFYMO_00755 [Streptomyces sp. NPDC007025]|uniref:hypothetical protein n=1 Tax=Streptomyces sp. NPDC007025 TaxID=3364771 RepID=UPI003687ADF6
MIPGPLTRARIETRDYQAVARMAAAEAPDEMIRGPLWEWHPLAAKAVLHERRRRFGIEEERIDVLTEEDSE